MVDGSTDLGRRARSIFDDLGYTVVGDGPEFQAERAWKVVQVTATETVPEPAGRDGLQCYVATREQARSIRRRLARAEPDFEWALIAVDGDDYEVERAPPGPDAVA